MGGGALVDKPGVGLADAIAADVSVTSKLSAQNRKASRGRGKKGSPGSSPSGPFSFDRRQKGKSDRHGDSDGEDDYVRTDALLAQKLAEKVRILQAEAAAESASSFQGIALEEDNEALTEALNEDGNEGEDDNDDDDEKAWISGDDDDDADLLFGDGDGDDDDNESKRSQATQGSTQGSSGTKSPSNSKLLDTSGASRVGRKSAGKSDQSKSHAGDRGEEGGEAECTSAANAGHLTLADLIFEKLEDRTRQQADEARMALFSEGTKKLFGDIGKFLSRYRSGKLPKGVRIIPLLRNWVDVLRLTKYEDWSSHAVEALTSIFVNGLKEKEAQRYMRMVLLPAFKEQVADKQRLNIHLFKALQKAVFKPAAFFKAVFFPVVFHPECSYKEAVLICAVLSKVTFPPYHAAAVLVKLLTHPLQPVAPSAGSVRDYSGNSGNPGKSGKSVVGQDGRQMELQQQALLASQDARAHIVYFAAIKVLHKGHDLPAPAIKMIATILVSDRATPKEVGINGRKLTAARPVIWHQLILAFVQRWKRKSFTSTFFPRVPLLKVLPFFWHLCGYEFKLFLNVRFLPNADHLTPEQKKDFYALVAANPHQQITNAIRRELAASETQTDTEMRA